MTNGKKDLVKQKMATPTVFFLELTMQLFYKCIFQVMNFNDFVGAFNLITCILEEIRIVAYCIRLKFFAPDNFNCNTFHWSH